MVFLLSSRLWDAVPLPEREVSSLTLSSPNGPQARQKNYEWMSVRYLDVYGHIR